MLTLTSKELTTPLKTYLNPEEPNLETRSLNYKKTKFKTENLLLKLTSSDNNKLKLSKLVLLNTTVPSELLMKLLLFLLPFLTHPSCKSRNSNTA